MFVDISHYRNIVEEDKQLCPKILELMTNTYFMKHILCMPRTKRIKDLIKDNKN